MALWDRLTTFMSLTAFQDSTPLQRRDAEEGSIQDLWERMTGRPWTANPWRMPSVREALGVPSIYRAVSLIANTTGALTLEAWRAGTKLAPEDRPRLVIRPDPFRVPRSFFRDTAWNIATRGEAWWWIAARDVDRSAMSLLNVPPSEIVVSHNDRDPRYPLIDWRGQRMRNEDMVQITLNQDDGGLRGVGPLQLCGAAASVAVEAQEWAANFFSEGGIPSTVIKSAVQLTAEEATALKTQWTDVPNNVPRIIDQNIESVEDHKVDVASSSMFDARSYDDVNAARMFGVPATLLDTAVAGSSLTYQNLETEFGKFVRGCLWPNYPEGIEQAMSDLLTRQTICRFDVSAFLRPDAKTRYEVYKLGVETGVMAVEEARVQEGLDSGSAETAPMPFSPPQAIPASLPIEREVDGGPVRCNGCGKARFIVLSTEPLVMRCIRCQTVAA
jgi:HK97 family phage portal protein